MSSSLFAITAQSNTGSDWNWFLIFIIFVVILVIALLVQAMFSKKDADELEFHEEEAHAEPPETQPAKPQIAPAVPAKPKPAPKPAPAPEPKPETKPEPEAKLEPVPEVKAPAPDPDPVPEKPIKPDDLKKIEGIGPKVASLLNENGITTFAQLAVASVEKLDEILDANKLQMMDPGSLPQQAQLAAASDWAALEKLQDELKGGR